MSIKHLSLSLALVTGTLLGVWTVQAAQPAPNDKAAMRVERKFRQYKRVHQEVLKKILEEDPNNVNIITCLYDDIIGYISSNSKIDISKISLVPSSGSSDEKYLSFMPKDIHKGIAIDEYCSFLNIDKSKIFAIGDGLNDIEMLSSVGYSVAMGNSVPELFQICKFSTKSFIENGTIEALDWIIEGLN